MDKGGTAMKRWKKMMAFCFAFLMSFVMFGSSVEAANGPNEQDWSSAYIVIDDGSANPKQLYNANKSVTISTVKNISYDKKTNTLTLSGYQEAEKKIVANEMGDDFKVKVVGNNQIQGIAVWGYSYGGSLTLEGNGSLEINKNRVQGEPIFLMAEEANAQFKVKQGVTLKVYRDNKFPSSIVVSYSAVAKDGIVFEGNDTLNQKVQKTSQKEAKRMTAAVYELADFIPCTPKDDSVTGIYGALRQAGSSDDEPYYNIYKIQEVFPEIWIASMQDENGNYFWSSNFTINTNAQKIKAYTTSVTSYSLMMLNKKTSSGTVSDYVAYFDYDQQKNEEVCSIYKIKKKANKNYAIPVEGEQNQPMSILDKYEIVPTGRIFYNYNFDGDILYSGSSQNTKPNIDTNDNTNSDASKNPTSNIRLVSSIHLSAISKKIAAGKKLTLKATVLPNNASNKKLNWKSSNPKVATVTQSGIVTLKKKTGGKKVTITATAKDGSKKYASWKITSMKGIVKKVKITGSKPIKAGKKLKLKAKVTATKKANTKLLWTSGNAKYATVNAKGIVTTKKSAKGKTVKITAMATDGSGKKHTVKIKIK
mgnify:CR=1 FL=1